MATRMHPQPMKISNHKTFCMTLSRQQLCVTCVAGKALRALRARRYVRCRHSVRFVAYGNALPTCTARTARVATHVTRAGKREAGKRDFVLFRRLSQDSAVPPAKGLDETCAELPKQRAAGLRRERVPRCVYALGCAYRAVRLCFVGFRAFRLT